MKNVITIIIAVIAFSINSFSQISSKNFPNLTRGGTDKLIAADMQSGDQVSSKISPLLNLFLNRVEKNNGMNLQLLESAFKEVLFFSRNELDHLVVPVFIKAKNISSAESIISSYGGKYNYVSSNIFTAEIPFASVRAIASSDEIVYIEPSTVSEMKLDVSIVETKVAQIHSGSGIPRPYKGSGVVVGIVDSGIDWKHQDFKNSGGSRIKYLWDMSGQGNPPSGYSYGTEYTKTQLDANQCYEVDGDDGGGHGTHVSGTAAGSGGAISTYTGMAPESDIIFVKGFREGPGFASTDVVDGCNYIFQKAGQLGKPAAINLSLGGHYGAHDGTSLYEQSLSGLTGPGKIIVAAAGNEGGDPIHLSYTSTGSSFNDAFETFFELESQASVVVADMWYSSGNINVGLAAYDTSSLQLIGYSPGIAPGQKIEDAAFQIQGYTYGYITIDATGVNNPNNGANEVVVVIDSHNGQIDIRGVYWTLFTYGSGTFDAWTIAGGVFSTFSQNWYKPGDNAKTVGIPGTSANVICVGSYVTKDHWIDIDGVTRYQPGNPVVGKNSYFSSLGPSRDGRLKPDISAPGEVIIAAYSSFLTQTPRYNINQGGKHQKMQGTSMASPHVTGAVALLLEKNSTLNYSQTVDILKNTAKKDSYTGQSPNNTYGYGKLDAYNAFVNTPGGGGGGQIVNLIYDDGTPTSGYYWNGAGQGSANRMTPTLPNAKVTKMEIYITGVNAGTATYKPIILGISGGQPSGDLATLQSKTATSYPGWDPTDLTNYNIMVNGDFFVGLLYDGTNKPGYGYDQVNNGRAWDYTGSAWSSWTETYFMRATIQTLTSVAEMSSEIPENFSLSQNYPNPFNPSSSFRIELPQEQNVKIIIYDIQGRKVTELVNNNLRAGVYEITWNGKNDDGISVASGTYIYTFSAGNFFETKKMMLIK